MAPGSFFEEPRDISHVQQISARILTERQARKENLRKGWANPVARFTYRKSTKEYTGNKDIIATQKRLEPLTKTHKRKKRPGVCFLILAGSFSGAFIGALLFLFYNGDLYLKEPSSGNLRPSTFAPSSSPTTPFPTLYPTRSPTKLDLEVHCLNDDEIKLQIASYFRTHQESWIPDENGIHLKFPEDMKCLPPYIFSLMSSSNFSKVVSLDFSGIGIKELKPASFWEGKLANVQELDLSRNGISSLSSAQFMSLPSLKKLNLSYNAFTDLEETSILHAPDPLKEIIMDGNSGLVEVPIAFKILHKVEKLSFRNCVSLRRITEDSFSYMEKLKVLDLTNTPLVSMYSETTLRRIINLHLNYTILGY